MPEGVFYFEETIVQKTVKRMIENRMALNIPFIVVALRTETQMSMNFVPWKEIEEMCEKSESLVSKVCCKMVV